MPSKRKRIHNRPPTMSAFTPLHYEQLRTFLADMSEQFRNAASTSRRQYRIDPCDQYKRQLAYNKHAMKAVEYILSHIQTDERRHSNVKGDTGNGTGTDASGGN